MALQLYEKDLENEEILSRKLITLAEIIVRKHFYASSEEKDDLVSIGVLKAIRMIHSDNFRRDKGNLCTFLYTGMRNDMHNYLYHRNKFDFVTLESVYGNDGVDDKYFNKEYIHINYGIVRLICMKFEKKYGKALEDLVIQKLYSYGVLLDGTSRNIKGISSINRELEDISDRVIGLIFWERGKYTNEEE